MFFSWSHGHLKGENRHHSKLLSGRREGAYTVDPPQTIISAYTGQGKMVLHTAKTLRPNGKPSLGSNYCLEEEL